MNTLITHFRLRNAVPLLLVKGAAPGRGWAMMLLISLPADSDDRLSWSKFMNYSGCRQNFSTKSADDPYCFRRHCRIVTYYVDQVRHLLSDQVQ